MAERRMFTKKITLSDEFISMPHSSQNLYFHLNMEADDEGFVNGVKRIMRTINANEDDLKILLTKRFVLAFESGVIVIKHWKLHNTIRNDRGKPTEHLEEKSRIIEKENGVYTERQPNDNHVTTKCLRSIGEISIDKVSIDKYGEFENVKLSHDEYKKLISKYSQVKTNDYIERLSGHIESKGKRYKSHYATILNWIRRDEDVVKQDQSTDEIVPDYMIKSIETKNSDSPERQALLKKLREK